MHDSEQRWDSVRDSYDRVADAYVEMVDTTGVGDLRDDPWLRAAVDAFAATVDPTGPVLDVGCGPGTITGYLADKGLAVSGIDLSPRMIEHARQRFPHCRFEVGSATDLQAADSSLAGILGWWSLFHIPHAELTGVLTAIGRALRPGGSLLLATHVGNGERVRTEAYGGVPVEWTSYLWQPTDLIAVVQTAGLILDADLRMPARGPVGPAVVLAAHRPLASSSAASATVDPRQRRSSASHGS